MNGNERLFWCQRADGHVFLTSPESPIPPGHERFSTTTPSEMDRIFAKLDKQEKAAYAEMTERAYNARREFIEQNLSNLNHRLANSTNPAERDVIRAWITAFNNKQHKLQQNTVYGVSAMQTTEANPKAPGDNRVYFTPKKEEDRGEAIFMLPPSETVQ